MQKESIRASVQHQQTGSNQEAAMSNNDESITTKCKTLLHHHALSSLLSDDLVLEILSKLPVKSLLRFKCVSHHWNSIISSSDFINSHFHRSSTDPTLRHHRFISTLYSIPKEEQEQEAMCHSLPEGIAFSISLRSLIDYPSSSSSSMPLLFDYPLFELGPHPFIVGSCNGLICSVNDKHTPNPYLCYFNPSTKFISTAPFFHRPKGSSCMIGFGYDHESDNYKTVAIYKPDNYKNNRMVVHTLGGRRGGGEANTSWKNIPIPFPFPFIPMRNFGVLDKGCFVNGTLNWLCFQCGEKEKTLVILSVDIGKETFDKFSPPPVELQSMPKLWVLEGCLCFSYDFNCTHFVLWQMKVYGVVESWTALLNISYVDDIAIKPRYPAFIFILGNDEILLEFEEFIIYDLRNNSFRYVGSRSKMMSFESTTYIESMVSPAQPIVS